MVFNKRKKRRSGSTIPFGYKLNGNYLFAVTNEINSYQNVKKLILSGKLSLREAAKKIEKETNRKLSHAGLSKILGSDVFNWQKITTKSRLLIKEKNIKQKKLREKRIKEEKYFFKLNKIKQKKLEEEKNKSLKPKQCKICGFIKKYSDFRGYGSRSGRLTNYCNNCYKKLLDKKCVFHMICRRCDKKKNINKFVGTNYFNAYKYRICKSCEIERDKKWRLNNPDKIRKIIKKYRAKNVVKIIKYNLYNSTDLKKDEKW